MFLWRDKDRSGDDSEADGEVVNPKLAKHRNGPTGEVVFGSASARRASSATRASGSPKPADHERQIKPRRDS